MPLYHYVCEKCEHDFEELVFGAEEIECPQCYSKKLERQLPLLGKPQIKGAIPSACGDPSLSPCGAPGCRRTGKR